MTGDVHVPLRRTAVSALASTLASLRRLPPAGTRVRLVPAPIAPAAVEIIVVAALVLQHHLPALLVAAGIKGTLHD
ncbi:MAG: hypothetical protein IT555_20100 [Acetobacteraceae bacterium]|nr:hypothetical protein [Acetobacteraceae bacterium]